MDWFARLLMRMVPLIRRPPSLQRLILIAVVVALGLGIALVEWLGFWPDALRVEKLPRNPAAGLQVR